MKLSNGTSHETLCKKPLFYALLQYLVLLNLGIEIGISQISILIYFIKGFIWKYIYTKVARFTSLELKKVYWVQERLLLYFIGSKTPFGLIRDGYIPGY
jgi:hypothetical protein